MTLLLFLISSTLYANEYEAVMKTTIAKINSASTLAEFNELANTFECIGEKEKDAWLPDYYAAYCYAMASKCIQMEAEEVHQLLDKSQTVLDRLMKLREEDEIYCLQAMVYQFRITDASKGREYSQKANQMLKKALAINANNPRAVYLHASNLFYTPEAYGGGKEVAKVFLEKASTLFAQQDTSGILPIWGAYLNEMFLKGCNTPSSK